MTDDIRFLEYYESYLTSAPVQYSYPMQVQGAGGHPNCFGVTLYGGVTCYVKPSNGTPNSTRAVYNEVAGWETAKLMYAHNLMAPTVLRYGLVSPITNTTTTVASAQVYWSEATVAPPLATLSPIEIEQAGAFDYLVQHSDRSEWNMSNYLGVTAPTAAAGTVVHLALIDNGFSFDFPGRTPESIFVDAVRGRTLSAETIAGVANVAWSAASSPLADLLERDSLERLIERAERLATHRRIC